MNYTASTKRHDFILLFDVTNGNPNGDPDAGNLPRMDPETLHGLVSGVALKRKVRDYVALSSDSAIFVQSEVALNTLILKAFRDIGIQPPQIPIVDEELVEWFEENSPEGFDLEDGVLIYGGESTKARDIQNSLFEGLQDTEQNKGLRAKLRTVAIGLEKAGKKQDIGRSERMQARERLCKDYYDIRMFGAVLATGLNAGQVRGPMQLTFARSVHPVITIDNGITRQARTTTARMQTGPTEMGRKYTIPYGLYRAHGFFNPFLAEQTSVTPQDLEVFWSSLCRMFEYDRSASRGMMACRGVYIFTHENPLGNAPAHKLFERVAVERREGVDTPRGFGDYEVIVDDDDLPNGVMLTRLCV